MCDPAKLIAGNDRVGWDGADTPGAWRIGANMGMRCRGTEAAVACWWCCIGNCLKLVHHCSIVMSLCSSSSVRNTSSSIRWLAVLHADPYAFPPSPTITLVDVDMPESTPSLRLSRDRAALSLQDGQDQKPEKATTIRIACCVKV
eukprot:278335-Chlamydomonas_euryale.AAC.10